MNLQETVSKILKREVTIEESKEFALKQFGTLHAYINRPREIRAYILSADEDFDFEMSGYEIENWVLYYEQHGKHLDNALAFIERCEEVGSVCSLYGLHSALNIEEGFGSNDYIFITTV